MIPGICFKISWGQVWQEGWKKQVNLGWSPLRRVEKQVEFTRSFCLLLCLYEMLHEKELKGIHRRLFPASSLLEEVPTLQSPGKESVFMFKCKHLGLSAVLLKEKPSGVGTEGYILAASSLVILCSLKLEKHWLKLSDYLLKVNNHFWINLFGKFRFFEY